MQLLYQEDGRRRLPEAVATLFALGLPCGAWPPQSKFLSQLKHYCHGVAPQPLLTGPILALGLSQGLRPREKGRRGESGSRAESY